MGDFFLKYVNDIPILDLDEEDEVEEGMINTSLFFLRFSWFVFIAIEKESSSFRYHTRYKRQICFSRIYA